MFRIFNTVLSVGEQITNSGILSCSTLESDVKGNSEFVFNKRSPMICRNESDVFFLQDVPFHLTVQCYEHVSACQVRQATMDSSVTSVLPFILLTIVRIEEDCIYLFDAHLQSLVYILLKSTERKEKRCSRAFLCVYYMPPAMHLGSQYRLQ